MSKSATKLPLIGISIGDLNGIGPEIVLNTFQEGGLLQYFTPIIYGSAQTILYHKKALGIKNFNFQQIETPSRAHPRKVNLINAWQGEVRIEIGVPDKSVGSAAFQAFEAATKDLVEGNIDGLVTAPINKKTIQSERFKFPGHTEYLAEQFNSDQHIMMMVGENLKLATVTGHIPLAEVKENISKKKVLKAIKILNKSLIEDFAIERPRIAVLGLNPHAGENGLLGTEEEENIIPAIDEANRNGITAFGPYPADGFFGTCMYCDFDAVLSMYHDQGLIPFKLMEFDRGVNYTAGLDGIRTSPDHGTAYSIAGKGKASNRSFIEALYLIPKILRNRQNYAESTENPIESKIGNLKED